MRRVLLLVTTASLSDHCHPPLEKLVNKVYVTWKQTILLSSRHAVPVICITPCALNITSDSQCMHEDTDLYADVYVGGRGNDCDFVTGHVGFHCGRFVIRIPPLSAVTTGSGTITKLTPVCLVSTSVYTGSFPSTTPQDHCLLPIGV